MNPAVTLLARLTHTGEPVISVSVSPFRSESEALPVALLVMVTGVVPAVSLNGLTTKAYCRTGLVAGKIPTHGEKGVMGAHDWPRGRTSKVGIFFGSTSAVSR